MLCTTGTWLWYVPLTLRLRVAMELGWPWSWGCLPEAFLPGRKKRLLRLKTIALAVPVAQKSITRLSTIDEVISTSPVYQTVPDFQRVQITGDYASGVGTCMAIPFPKLTTISSSPCLSLSSAERHRTLYQVQWG